MCQLNVEFHNPDSSGRSHVQALELIAALVANQSFIPLMTATVLDPLVYFNRIFFVNVKSRECIEKFLCRS